MTVETKPLTALELLARLPDIPHTGSYDRKDTIIMPYIKGNEVDPNTLKKNKDQTVEKEEKKSQKNRANF